MGLKLITPPAAEPVSLDDLKLDLGISWADQDARLAALIASAREACEHELGRALITQTWELVLDAFPAGIRLPYPPCQSVESVKYLDADGVLQTLSAPSYQLDSHSEPAWLVPAWGYAWPATRPEPNAVRVRFVAGFGDAAADVPANICAWIRLQAAHFYHNAAAASDLPLIMTPYTNRLLDRHRIYGAA